MRRFVLLQHDLPADASRASHFDLMLCSIDDSALAATEENAKVLWTWEVPLALAQSFASEEPLAASQPVLPVQPLEDHRLAYLTLEGPISGNRGSVRQVDAGTYTIEGLQPPFPTDAPPFSTPIRLNVFGKKLCGIFEIFYEQNQWWLRKIFARS